MSQLQYNYIEENLLQDLSEITLASHKTFERIFNNTPFIPYKVFEAYLHEYHPDIIQIIKPQPISYTHHGLLGLFTNSFPEVYRDMVTLIHGKPTNQGRLNKLAKVGIKINWHFY